MRQLPQEVLDQHCLAGPFLFTDVAHGLLEGKEDLLMPWFNTSRCQIRVGDDVVIPCIGLRAYFWFDPDRPNGQCFGVTVYGAVDDPEAPRASTGLGTTIAMQSKESELV